MYTPNSCWTSTYILRTVYPLFLFVPNPCPTFLLFTLVFTQTENLTTSTNRTNTTTKGVNMHTVWNDMLNLYMWTNIQLIWNFFDKDFQKKFRIRKVVICWYFIFIYTKDEYFWKVVGKRVHGLSSIESCPSSVTLPGSEKRSPVSLELSLNLTFLVPPTFCTSDKKVETQDSRKSENKESLILDYLSILYLLSVLYPFLLFLSIPGFFPMLS